MSLRLATVEDIPLIKKMADKFISNSPFSKLKDENTIETLIQNFVNGDKENVLVILYEDIGMLAAIRIPFMFGSIYQASEIAWWVEPDKRGNKAGKALMEAFEFWAKKVGCSLITMGCLTEEVGKIYAKNGYKLYVNTYAKEI